MLSLAGAGTASVTPARPGRPIEPSGSSYAQAWLMEGASRLLFISGQTPVDAQGQTPRGFEEQARLVWANIRAQLRRADMDFANLAKITVYLSHRRHRALNTRVRTEVLGQAAPAITVVIAGIFDEAWHLEIDAIACA